MLKNTMRTGTRVLGALALSLSLVACGGNSNNAMPGAPSPDWEDWEDIQLSVTGRGIYPDGRPEGQAAAMAMRAARTDAYAKLAEELYGVELRGSTTVRDAVLANDVLETRVQGFIQGAEVTDTRRRPDLGIVEVDMDLLVTRDFARSMFR